MVTHYVKVVMTEEDFGGRPLSYFFNDEIRPSGEYHWIPQGNGEVWVFVGFVTRGERDEYMDRVSEKFQRGLPEGFSSSVYIPPDDHIGRWCRGCVVRRLRA